MKFKPTNHGGGVLVELGPKETQLPVAATGTSVEPRQIFKLKKILVPVDFSACSEKALAYAIPFARQFGAELTLLYVLEPYLPVPEMAAMDVETMQLQAREGCQEALAKVHQSVPAEVASKSELRLGNPPFEITQAAKDIGADLIIISTHGRTGLRHVFLGSTTERVVRHASCPVLVVREDEHEFVAANSTRTVGNL
ncbi:MAG: universal stress protein [Verrucomicrobia bacterium]|nr:universal stress protein [Verrucomicrobiota bacterium]